MFWTMWEPYTYTCTQRPLPLKTDFPTSTCQPDVTFSQKAAGQALFLGGRKGSPRDWVFRPPSHSKCGALQTPVQEALKQALTSRAEKGLVSRALSCRANVTEELCGGNLGVLGSVGTLGMHVHLAAIAPEN